MRYCAVVQSTASSNRWLYGAVPDLLLGCGVLYMIVFVVLLFAGESVRTSQPILLIPLLGLLTATPHYGATLLRVYNNRRERRSYAVFSVWITLALIGAGFLGLHDPWVGSLLVTVFITWSPWHYTGQNYGIAVMLLRRRGVEVTPTDRRLLYWAFVLSYVFVFLVMHVSNGDGGIAPTTFDYTATKVAFLPLGIPPSVSGPLAAAALLGSVVLFGAFSVRNGASWRGVYPAGLLVVTQALWFMLPLAIKQFGVHTSVDSIDPDNRIYYQTWIAFLGHSTQYLWITSWYARRTPEWPGFTGYYARVLAAGAGATALPLLIFGPFAGGSLSLDAGLLSVCGSILNLHHFILDGAIWKLRGRIGQVLIRNQPPDLASSPTRFGLLLRPLVWTACACGIGIEALLVFGGTQATHAIQEHAPAAAKRNEDRLGWFGIDRSGTRREIGVLFLRAGLVVEGRKELLRSIDLDPSWNAYGLLAASYEVDHNWRKALEAYDAGLELKPQQAQFWAGSAVVLEKLGRLEEAYKRIRRASELTPNNPAIRKQLIRIGALHRSRP